MRGPARDGRSTATVHARRPAFARATDWIAVLRPHQWSKNLLVFVPLVAAHRFADQTAIAAAAVMFVAMCLAASAVYIDNDLGDRDSDRRHARKRARPFATGAIGERAGRLASLALLAGAFALTAMALPVAAVAALATYVAGAAAYTRALKRIAWIDVATLALLYVARIAAGGVATGILPSPWLSGFALPLFASLALAKRYAELRERRDAPGSRLPGRGYVAADLPRLRAAGAACSLVAAMLVAVYASSLVGSRNYRTPELLVAVAPLLLVWLARVWTRASDGRLHDDPVVDAATDPLGLAIAAAGVAAFVAAI